MNKKEEAKLRKAHAAAAAKMEWCDLALETIRTSQKLSFSKGKALKLLELKIDVYEEEKAWRVMDDFSFDYFVNKQYQYILEDDFDFSVI